MEMEEEIYFSPEDQYLIFFIGDDSFAICIKNIVQVIKYIKPSKLPQTSEFISGIIPFRGEVIPVVDFHGEMNFIPNDYSIIIVVKIKNKMVGIIADSIYKIVQIKEAEMEKTKANDKYISGITIKESLLLIILNLEEIEDIDSMSTLLKTADEIKKKAGE